MNFSVFLGMDVQVIKCNKISCELLLQSTDQKFKAPYLFLSQITFNLARIGT